MKHDSIKPAHNFLQCREETATTTEYIRPSARETVYHAEIATYVSLGCLHESPLQKARLTMRCVSSLLTIGTPKQPFNVDIFMGVVQLCLYAEKGALTLGALPLHSKLNLCRLPPIFQTWRYKVGQALEATAACCVPQRVEK